jgi:hypothetical protein
LAIERSASPAAAFADVQRNFIAELDGLKIALGIMELFSPISGRAALMRCLVTNRIAKLANTRWPR